MNFAWALQLMPADAFTLAPLRLISSIEIGEMPQCLWLRGKPLEEKPASLLQSLPAVARFECLPDGRLRRVESRIPTQALPALQWQPITQWLQVHLPTAGAPAPQPARARISLARSGEELPCNVLRTDLAEWNRFVLEAPEVRLRPLRFAVSESLQVVVWGTPLPSIPGRRYVEQDGIATPAGFSWQPAISSKVVRQLFQAGDNSLVIWDEQSCIHLHPEQLMPATRSGVRATAEALRIAE